MKRTVLKTQLNLQTNFQLSRWQNKIPAGIPQGPVFSATPSRSSERTFPCPLLTTVLSILQYANNVIIYNSTNDTVCRQARLNSYLNDLYRYFTKNLFLNINSIPIPTVKKVVYVGGTITSNLSNIAHFTKPYKRHLQINIPWWWWQVSGI